MDASVSKIVGGWKGLLLKPANRYFKRAEREPRFDPY